LSSFSHLLHVGLSSFSSKQEFKLLMFSLPLPLQFTHYSCIFALVFLPKKDFQVTILSLIFVFLRACDICKIIWDKMHWEGRNYTWQDL
jgi:hypothetical protein